MEKNYNERELDEASGYGQRSYVQFPYIKFISAGSEKSASEVKSFVLLKKGEGDDLEAKDLGKKIKVIFISRGRFKLKKGSFTTNEISPKKNQEIDLYKINKSTGKRAFYEKGGWQELKAKYNLSTFQLPYVLLGDEIVKLGILPSSLNNYWEYVDSFKKEERIYYYETTLMAADEPKESEGGTYYQMEFVKGERVKNPELVAEKIMELKEIQEQIEETFEEKEEVKKVEKIELPDSESIPIIEDEEIDMKDIPF